MSQVSDYSLRPWQVSLITHAGVVLMFFVLSLLKIQNREVLEVPIEFSSPSEIQNLEKIESKPQVVLKSVNATKAVEENKKSRQVFGTSRQSYIDDTSKNGVDAKMGNTLAKDVDKEILNADDLDSLPTPTEEYLVSEMPSVINEVRPVYPKKAKDERLDGVVDLDVLIDEKGFPRQINVIEGPEIFRSGAVEAMKKFRFRPAQVDGKPVAVRIRYSLRFELEY